VLGPLSAKTHAKMWPNEYSAGSRDQPRVRSYMNVPA